KLISGERQLRSEVGSRSGPFYQGLASPDLCFFQSSRSFIQYPGRNDDCGLAKVVELECERLKEVLAVIEAAFALDRILEIAIPVTGLLDLSSVVLKKDRRQLRDWLHRDNTAFFAIISREASVVMAQVMVVDKRQ